MKLILSNDEWEVLSHKGEVRISRPHTDANRRVFCKNCTFRELGKDNTICRNRRTPLRGLCYAVGTEHGLAAEDVQAAYVDGGAEYRVSVDVDVRSDLKEFDITLTRL